MNKESNNTRLMSGKRYEKSDIFNRQPVNNDINSFKNCYSNNRSIFNESRNEKKLIDDGRTKRPEFIRNPFISQISIK